MYLESVFTLERITMGAFPLLALFPVLSELTLGHLRYHFTDVPPPPNSTPDNVFHAVSQFRHNRLKSQTCNVASSSVTKKSNGI